MCVSCLRAACQLVLGNEPHELAYFVALRLRQRGNEVRKIVVTQRYMYARTVARPDGKSGKVVQQCVVRRCFKAVVMRPLTPRQAEILAFIRDWIAQTGSVPTVRAIAQGFEIKSPNGVRCHLKALHDKGVIIRFSDRKACGFKLVGKRCRACGGTGVCER